jgi:hypothetical protein
MARLPDLQADAPGVDAALAQRLLQRRGGRLLNLDKQLLHSPSCRRWNHMGAIRRTVLDGQLHERILLVAS